MVQREPDAYSVSSMRSRLQKKEPLTRAGGGAAEVEDEINFEVVVNKFGL